MHERRGMHQRRVLLIVGCLALGAFLVAYSHSTDRPGVSTRNGYYGWADQLNYRLEARALRDGVLPGIDYDYTKSRPKPSYDRKQRPLYDYAYGLGYPVLAVPATFLGWRTDPFALPDALLFAAEVMIVVVLGTRLRSRTFGLVVAAALVLASPLLQFTVVPWSNSVTTLTVLVALLIATNDGEHPARDAIMLGVAVGVCFAARYADALLPAAIGGVALLMRKPRSLRPVFGAAAIALALALPILWTQSVVFGSPFTTPYAHHMRGDTSDQSLGAFDPGRAPRSFVETFITGKADGGAVSGTPMIAEFPWMVFAPVGIFALVRRRRAERRVYAAAAIVSGFGSLFYLAFRASTGADLVNHNLRYYVPWVPVWGLLSAYGIVYVAEMVRARIRRAPAVAAHRPIPEIHLEPARVGVARIQAALDAARLDAARRDNTRVESKRVDAG